ncbi:unnamed protein product [Cylindrotheca closterium]|uniref:Protein Mpv17 n=1 Tax=Cylindrotheca closterium TaxID=2856 RepID=A0AAD2FIG4_9STRA|nr:unnamed protein product [Cylindrotheca closterium]
MMVNTAIVKAAVIFAATLRSDGDQSPPGKRSFRLPFLQRKVTSEVAGLPALDITTASKDGLCVAPEAAAAIAIRGGEQTEKQSFLQRHPFMSACGITTLNAFSADLLTQCVFEANPWNPKRSAVFAAFGFLYQGMAQYAIVNLGWEKLFPGNKPKAVISKICGMNLLSDPILFMPTFYIFKEVMAQGGFGLATVKAALLGYKANCLLDWRNSWLIWFPGHCVTYGVMKPHQRIPWIAFLSFFYMCILSITRGGV